MRAGTVRPRRHARTRRPCRLEPLAMPSGDVQRALFVPLFKGGKRIHLAVQVGSSAQACCMLAVMSGLEPGCARAGAGIMAGTWMHTGWACPSACQRRTRCLRGTAVLWHTFRTRRNASAGACLGTRLVMVSITMAPSFTHPPTPPPPATTIKPGNQLFPRLQPHLSAPSPAIPTTITTPPTCPLPRSPLKTWAPPQAAWAPPC